MLKLPLWFESSSLRQRLSATPAKALLALIFMLQEEYKRIMNAIDCLHSSNRYSVANCVCSLRILFSPPNKKVPLRGYFFIFVYDNSSLINIITPAEKTIIIHHKIKILIPPRNSAPKLSSIYEPVPKCVMLRSLSPICKGF